jgi:hypothetical protein
LQFAYSSIPRTVAGKGKSTIDYPRFCPPVTHADWHVADFIRFLAHHHRDAVVDNHNIPPSQILSNE